MASQECLMLWSQDFLEQSCAHQSTADEELFLKKNVKNYCVFRNKHDWLE